MFHKDPLVSVLTVISEVAKLRSHFAQKAGQYRLKTPLIQRDGNVGSLFGKWRHEKGELLAERDSAWRLSAERSMSDATIVVKDSSLKGLDFANHFTPTYSFGTHNDKIVISLNCEN